MYPYLNTPFGDISTFALMVSAGIVFMILMIHFRLKEVSNRDLEEEYIFPKIVISLISAFIFSGFVDALFKLPQNGRFILSGITFYGGLLGAIAVIYLLLSITKSKTKLDIKSWFDVLTPAVIVFHICGRVGCFLGGCCYGKVTDTIWGVSFIDNAAAGIFHYGQKCYPTQLFEVTALLLILFIVLRSKNKFYTYLMMYSVSRFFIEFFRGDSRGAFIAFLSPAQIISIGIIVVCVIFPFVNNRLVRKNNI